jgi:iron(III) transport system substrate-binding protein
MRRLAKTEVLFLVSTFIIPLSFPAPVAAQLPPAVEEAAKKEGEVVIYGAVEGKAARPIIEMFESRYGVKVNNWRGDAEDVVNRVLEQNKNGKILFDVVLGNETVMATLERKGLLDSFEPPAAQSFARHFLHPERTMTPWRALPFGINFNNERLRPDQAPKSWEDLLHPKWRKKFVMPNPALHPPTLQFILNLDKVLGSKWLALVEGWAKQRPQLTKGFPEEIPLLTSGQALLGISYIKDKFQFAGPIDYVRMNQYLASLSYIAVGRRAPRPNAARLFVDFFLGPEPQQIFANLGEYVLHPDIDARFRNEVNDEQLIVMRQPSEAETEKWTKKFREMFKP